MNNKAGESPLTVPQAVGMSDIADITVICLKVFHLRERYKEGSLNVGQTCDKRSRDCYMGNKDAVLTPRARHC
jgi:hypothetical protein